MCKLVSNCNPPNRCAALHPGKLTSAACTSLLSQPASRWPDRGVRRDRAWGVSPPTFLLQGPGWAAPCATVSCSCQGRYGLQSSSSGGPFSPRAAEGSRWLLVGASLSASLISAHTSSPFKSLQRTFWAELLPLRP